MFRDMFTRLRINPGKPDDPQKFLPLHNHHPFFLYYLLIRGADQEEGIIMTDLLASFYPWIKSLHIMAVISWMAGLFYLPRLFVHHVEQAQNVEGLSSVFETMELKLLRVIMNPAMFVVWIAGLGLVFTPGVVDWSSVWPWIKATAVLGMTWYHHWLALRRKDFLAGKNTLTGRQYRLMNEVPTALMVVIVLSVVVKF